jgi:hypothetical protein
MSAYTYDQLEQALGSTFKLVPCGDKKQARIQTADGFDIAFIDIEDGRIEASLCAKWYTAKETAPEGFPGPQDIAAARQEIAEELQPDWEIAGFTVPDESSVGSYWYRKEPDAKLPMYELPVTKDVLTLEEVVETIQWVRNAETETLV